MSHVTGSIVFLLLIVATEIFIIWLVFLDTKTKSVVFKSLRKKVDAILNTVITSITTIIAVLSLLILIAWFLLVVNFDTLTK